MPARANMRIQLPEKDLIFEGSESVGVSHFGSILDSGLTATMFSINGARSRSAITSLTISRSIASRRRAHPSDIALKQTVLILRGIPRLYSAINFRAPNVNRDALLEPATHNR